MKKFSFSLEPVVEIVAIFPTASLVQGIRTLSNLFLRYFARGLSFDVGIGFNLSFTFNFS